MSSTSHAIVLDTRLWDMSRNISGVIDVCVELIINADDAYRKRFTPGPITEDVDIRVNIDYKKRYVTVCDDAIGMTFDELMSKMTRVGGYTADTTSRGYFSRGAKYIISIGDVTFTAIKNDLVQQIQLTALPTPTYKVLMKNIPVTSDLRMKYTIKGNGFHVGIKFHKHVTIEKFERMTQIRNHSSLRDIFASTKEHIMTTVTSISGTEEFDSNSSK